MSKQPPSKGDFYDYSMVGFSVNEEGVCYCESSGIVMLDDTWRFFEYIIPYEEVEGGLCFMNNKLVYQNNNPLVEANNGRTEQERIEICARKCQLYTRNGDAKGFSYLSSTATCYCEMLDSNCVVQDSNFKRFDFTLFNIFKHTEDAECRCGRDGGSECFNTLGLQV